MVPEITPGAKLAPPPAVSQAAVLSLDINLPNLITLCRLACVPLAIWLILGERYAIVFWVFVGAGVSDGVDGYIAKHFNQRTRLGALLDPAADKLLLAGVYLTLGYSGQLPLWLVVLVVSRDLLIVTGFAVINAITDETQQFGPLYISKFNTFIQIALVVFVLARLGLDIEAPNMTWLLVVVAAATTVLSGFAYLWRWARILRRTDAAA